MDNDQFQQLVIAEFRTINGRLDIIDGRLDRIDSKLEIMDNRLNQIDSRLFTIESNIEKISEWVPFRTPPLKFKEKIEA